MIDLRIRQLKHRAISLVSRGRKSCLEDLTWIADLGSRSDLNAASSSVEIPGLHILLCN